jgi:hypothetical protein
MKAGLDAPLFYKLGVIFAGIKKNMIRGVSL